MKKSLLSLPILLFLLLSCSSGNPSEESSSFSSSSSTSSESLDSYSKSETSSSESSIEESLSEESSLDESSEEVSSEEESSDVSTSSSEIESESEETSSEELSSEEEISSEESSESSEIRFSISESESESISEEESSKISESSESSSEVIPESYISRYDIIYDLGSRKTSYPFKEGEEELIKNCFAIKEDDEDIISSINSFSGVYGGGYGGSGDNAWISNNLLKLGTTSINSELTVNLDKKVDKVIITGMVSATTLKVEVNDVQYTCSDMAIASKETADNKAYTSFEVEIKESNTLSIKTTNKKVLYISQIELSYQDDSPIAGEKYTVTWKNYDGEVLEIDYEVPKGSTPKYDGKTPSKESDEEYNYVFSGWNPKVGPIYEDTTYVATFTPVSKDEKVRGSEPIISVDEKTVEYGIYPQKHVDDQELVDILDSLSMDSYNRVLYNNEYYQKVTSQIYNNESYTCDNKEAINNDTNYWFKCETIKWNVIKNDNNVLTLMSDSLVESHNFYRDYQNRNIDENIIYPNNYMESDVRYYLNNDFLQNAFFLGDNSIIETNNDKIYLPSLEEVNNLDNKTAKTTEYSRATGAFSNKESSYLYNGSYWTNTPSEDFTYCVYNVNSGGILSEYAVDGSSHCIRPMIKISLAI